MSNVNIKAYTRGLAVQVCVWGRCLFIQYRIILWMYSSSRLQHAAYLSNETTEASAPRRQKSSFGKGKAHY